jgi:hypothetical protein
MSLSTKKLETAGLIDELASLKDAGMMESDTWACQFTDSVVKQFHAHGHLTQKQWHWVKKIIERTLTPDEPQKVEKQSMQLGDYAEVYGMLHAGSSSLKWPKIWLQTPEGQQVKLALSGPSSKYPNTLNVTDGKPFGHNQWWGRILKDGTWVLPKVSVPSYVTMLVKSLAQDPVGMIQQYGKTTGNCCFCATELSDPKSVKAGFGPVCAKNYGLHDVWKQAAK